MYRGKAVKRILLEVCWLGVEFSAGETWRVGGLKFEVFSDGRGVQGHFREVSRPLPWVPLALVMKLADWHSQWRV